MFERIPLKSTIVPVSELQEEPYASVLCYPKATPNQIQGRLEELRKLGVKAIEFSGKAKAFTLPVLGKGYVGIVAVAHVGCERLALKMQRVDSDRESLDHEAELLVLANGVNVGAKFVGATKRFLLMQLVDGDLIEVWLENHKDAALTRKLLLDILEQCWRMDEIGLDHGELSKAPKHLLVDGSDKPFIVDFETASTRRNSSNVTSVCQFLFQGNSNVCKAVAEVIGEMDRTKMVEALKLYKKNRNRVNFQGILEVCLVFTKK